MHMQRTDLKIRDRIIPHPTKLRELKEDARARIPPDAIGALAEAVMDEELEVYIDQIVAEEIEEVLRSEIRALLARGVRK